MILAMFFVFNKVFHPFIRKEEEQNTVLPFYIENRSIVCFKSVACFSKSFNN
ncbi:hypothetical protein protein [Bacillus cereus G9241]|nr:hypothetical protein protein [Bacillus cereus G9241]